MNTPSPASFKYPSELVGLRVLVVDDEEDGRELLATILETCGCHPTTASCVSEAMEAIELYAPDIILSDIGMPGEDGYELIRRVRALPTKHSATPAAALTAYARAEDRQKALAAGFQMHIPKPVEPSKLITLMATLARVATKLQKRHFAQIRVRR